MRKKTNEEFQEELRQLREQGEDVYADDEYVGSKVKMWFYCSKGHRWQMKPNDILNGQRCPYCQNRKVLVGYNDLWTTHEYIARLLQNPQDGYEYTYGSKYKTYFTCPFCGNTIFKTIKEVYNRGLACQRCGDSISYPNKFMRAMLSQLSVENIVYEYSPSWLSPYSYDNYFEANGFYWVLEADGGLGHGNKKFGSNETDIDGIQRDKIKDEMAQQHNINVIRIDCNYKDENKYTYIKQNVLNSSLSQIVDLSCVDWDKCHLEALSSLVHKSAEMYNGGYSIGYIASNLGYNSGTITSWLKQATGIGLCEYNKTEARKRGRRYLYRAVNQYTEDNIFVKTHPSLSIASSATTAGITAIANCCKKKKHFHTSGGYKWFYADDPNQPDKTKIMNLTAQN